MTRQQLPAYSPLGIRDVLSYPRGEDARPALCSALEFQFQASRAVLTDSGTSALALALQLATAERPNRPCVLPAYGCFDLITAALSAGVRVRLYDINPVDLSPDLDSLARALEGGAAALVVVHFFGIAAPIDSVREMATNANAVLIEDAAQAHGGSWRNRPLGSFGDFAILSFGRGKGHTGGSGGALLMHGPAIHPVWQPSSLPAAAGAAREFSALAAQWIFGRAPLFGLAASLPFLHIGETVFHLPVPARQMSAGAARIVLRTKDRAGREASTRRATASRYLAAATGAQSVVRPVDGTVAGWLRFPIRLPDAANIPSLRALGAARSYPQALDRLPAARAILEEVRNTNPGADQLANQLWTLPTHSRLTEREIRALEAIVRAL